MIHSLRGLLVLMAGVTLVGMLVLGGIAVQSARDTSVQLSRVKDNSVSPLILLQTVERHIKEVRFRIAGVALEQLPTVGSANHLKEMRQSIPATWAAFEAASAGQAFSDEEKANLEKIRQGMKELDGLMARLMEAYQGDDMATIKSILEDDWPMVHSKVIKPLEQFVPYYESVAQAAFEEARQQSSRQLIVVVVLLVLSLGVVMAVNVYLQRRFSRQLQAARTAVEAVAGFNLAQPIQVQGQDEISKLLQDLAEMQASLRQVVAQVREGSLALENMSGELAGDSTAVAEASTRQAESASGMAASMEELSVSIDQMKDHATQSTQLAERSGEASREGREVTQAAAREMASIAEGARQSSAIVAELGSLSSEISGIVNVIRDIADQTNLLALNAAIEAARAGEQGRGFAVVADEVRKLAERTAASTQQISDMISRIQNGTRRAVDAMEADVQRANQGEDLARQAGQAIDQIEQRALDVVRAVNEIQSALNEQSSAARDVAVRVEHIAEMTETNSQASLRTSQNASQVSGLAARLNDLVAGFRV
ncbi:MAG: methyl-accepting chemotaxis protein [Pseudomonadota bacterium]